MRLRNVGVGLTMIATMLAGGAACGGNGDGNGGGTGPGGVCTFTIAPAAREFEPSAGTGQVAVTTAAGCSWTATASANWISITSGSPGTGPGTVTYSVTANTAEQSRTAGIDIGGQVHQVTQKGRTPGVCTYELAPSSADFFKQGGTGSFTVGAPAECGWTAVSNAPWVTVTAGAEGSGTGTVSYSVARNQQLEERVGTISVAGRTFTIRQEAESQACDYTVAPVEFTPCMPAGGGTVNVSTTAGCAWTVSPNVSWLAVSPESGSGPGVLTFSYTSNYDAPRDGALRVRWNTPTEGQNVWVKQAGCRYGVVPAAVSIAAAGGTATVTVTQQSEPMVCGGPTQDACVWTAAPDVPWITVTSSMPRTGDNPFSFTVAPNTGAARTGRITVRDKVVVVTQAGT